MTIHAISQPTDATCGQTCLAMLLGVKVLDMIAETGKKGATTREDLAKVLHRRGWTVAPRLIRVCRGVAPFGDSAIVRVHWTIGTETHWALWAETRYWDPLGQGGRATWVGGRGRITSILPLWRP